MFAVYFCPGCSATGNHSSKSPCINTGNIHTGAAALSHLLFHAQCCMSQPRITWRKKVCCCFFVHFSVISLLCQARQQEVFPAARRGSVCQWQCQVPGGVFCKRLPECGNIWTGIKYQKIAYNRQTKDSLAHHGKQRDFGSASETAWKWLQTKSMSALFLLFHTSRSVAS